MLKRNAPGWTSRGLGEPPRTEAMPPLLGGAYQLDPRYAAPEQRPSEWMRLPPAPAYYQAAPTAYPSPQPGYFVPEPMQTPPAGGSMADVVQNSRLDQLERTIRDLSGELVAERRAYGQLVGDMKRDAPAPIEMGQRYTSAQDDQQAYMMRGDTGPTGSQMADRLGHLERNIDAKLSDIARVWSTLGDRLQALEQAVVTVRSESSVPQGLVERFDGLDEVLPTLTKISERLTGLERQQSAKPTASVAINLQPIIERLTSEIVTPKMESTIKDEVELLNSQSEIQQIENTLEIAPKPKHDLQSQSTRNKGEQDDISFDFEAEVSFSILECDIMSLKFPLGSLLI